MVTWFTYVVTTRGWLSEHTGTSRRRGGAAPVEPRSESTRLEPTRLRARRDHPTGLRRCGRRLRTTPVPARVRHRGHPAGRGQPGAGGPVRPDRRGAAEEARPVPFRRIHGGRPTPGSGGQYP